MQANQRVYRLGAVGRPLSTDCCARDAQFTVVETPGKGGPWQPIARNRGNVGLYRPAASAIRHDRARLLDGADGKARRDPAAGRFRQQYRAAALLPVRAVGLLPGGVDRHIADV